MARKWGEVGVDEVDFKPVITDTHTVDWWRKYAKTDKLVKVKTDSTEAANNGLIPIEPCTEDTDIPIGTIRSVNGDPLNFPKKFIARVAVVAHDVNVKGSGTGALTDADYGKKIKPNSDGEADLVTSGGYGRVIGGDKANLRMSYDWRDNYR